MLATRRHWLYAATLAPLSVAVRAARKDFWQSKDPAAWTNDEKQILLNQSPWAREGALLMELQKGGGPTGPGYGNDGRPATDMPVLRPGVTPGGNRSVPIGEKLPPPPDPNARQPVKFRVLVRWETAKPIRLAGAPELPDLGGQFYVIRFHGVPLMPIPKPEPGQPPAANPNDTLMQQIKEGSRLERANKAPISCARMFAGSGSQSNEVLLLFTRDPHPIAEEDHVVTLESRFGQFHLSLKFPLAEMMYRGQLTL